MRCIHESLAFFQTPQIPRTSTYCSQEKWKIIYYPRSNMSLYNHKFCYTPYLNYCRNKMGDTWGSVYFMASMELASVFRERMLRRDRKNPNEPLLKSTDDGVHALVICYASKGIPIAKLLKLNYVDKELVNSGVKKGTIKALTSAEEYLKKENPDTNPIETMAAMVHTTRFFLLYTDVSAGVITHQEWSDDDLCGRCYRTIDIMDKLQQKFLVTDVLTPCRFQFLSEALYRVAHLQQPNFLGNNEDIFWLHYHLLTGGKIEDGPHKPSEEGLVQDKRAGLIITAHMFAIFTHSDEEFNEDRPGYALVFPVEADSRSSDEDSTDHCMSMHLPMPRAVVGLDTEETVPTPLVAASSQNGAQQQPDAETETAPTTES